MRKLVNILALAAYLTLVGCKDGNKNRSNSNLTNGRKLTLAEKVSNNYPNDEITGDDAAELKRETSQYLDDLLRNGKIGRSLIAQANHVHYKKQIGKSFIPLYQDKKIIIWENPKDNPLCYVVLSDGEVQKCSQGGPTDEDKVNTSQGSAWMPMWSLAR